MDQSDKQENATPYYVDTRLNCCVQVVDWIWSTDLDRYVWVLFEPASGRYIEAEILHLRGPLTAMEVIAWSAK